MPMVHPAEMHMIKIAYDLWCDDMRAQGWTRGPYDESKRTHDALVSFEGLPEVDRRSTVIGVTSRQMLDDLRESVSYPRGDNRQFAVHELYEGMRVGYEDDRSSLGTVVDWEAAPGWPDSLSSITVKWDSGELNEHGASEHELRRVGEIG